MTKTLLSIAELLEELGHPSTEKRVAALAHLSERPTEARSGLVALISNVQATDIARVWAAIGIGQLGDDESKSASVALVAVLHSGPPVVRWSAIHALGGLRAEHAVTAIANHLLDHDEIKGAWFEDDCKVSHAAEAALRQIGTVAALLALTAVSKSG